jgi:outer membrane protein assembly factor BamD
MRPWLLGALLVAFALGGCSKSAEPPRNPLEYAQNAKRDYDKALESFFDHDWEECITQMTAVKKTYAYSRYGRLAVLRIADAYFHQDKLADAVTAYKSFVHDYPNDPEVNYARYRIAQALFEQSSESAFVPPLEERDLVTVHEAYKTIRDYLNDYPRDRRRRHVEYMLEYTGGLLARHELYVARYYLRKDVYAAAVARAQYALDHYPGSGLEPEALVLLGETYLRMDQHEKARTIFVRVVRDHPDSPFTVSARNFLARLDRPTPEKRP